MPGFPEYVRAFAAVEIDAALRRRVHQAARRLLDGAGRVSRPPEENLHVTLKFVGEVHRDEIPALGDAVREGADLLVPGRLELRSFGAFPDLTRPRVIWAGVSDPEGILFPVHDRLNRSLTAFGAKQEKKRYVPHVTVGRVRGPFDREEFARRLERSGGAPLGEQRVRGITLFMSELGRGGPPRYTVLAHYQPGES